MPGKSWVNLRNDKLQPSLPVRHSYLRREDLGNVKLELVLFAAQFLCKKFAHLLCFRPSQLSLFTRSSLASTVQEILLGWLQSSCKVKHWEDKVCWIETLKKENIGMELDSVKLYETVVASREDPKEICQMEERIEREQNELQWIESTSRLAKFLTTRGLNSTMLLTSLREGNLPKERLEAHEIFR